MLGRENANRALGVSRRDLLKAAAAAPALGAFYFGYERHGRASRRSAAAIIGTGDEGCQAMIRSHNREYLDFIGFCDIRPSQQARAVKEFSNHKDYTAADVKKLKRYDNKEEMYADPDVEMIVIALPLWLHAPVAIEAMKAGKHVFTEKLMAHSVAECKEMCQVARETNRLLAVGHQRHYSVLYDNANYLVQNDVLGEIRHIRALWHRNNAHAPGRQGQERQPDLRPQDRPARDTSTTSRARSSTAIAGSASIPELDKNIDYKKYGYKSLDELINWRLYNRTGAGLMAELGSHQLDACSIFLGKKHPLAVTGIGGTFFYTDGREVDDHVFTALRVPRQGRERPGRRDLFVDQHQFVRRLRRDGDGLAGDDDRRARRKRSCSTRRRAARPRRGTTSVTVERRRARSRRWRPARAGRPDRGGVARRPGHGRPSRGYREELEHFAYCVRHGNASNYHADKDHQPRCRGEVALADAVIALTSNIAMRQKRRIEFDPRWFDYQSPETPEECAEIAQRT